LGQTATNQEWKMISGGSPGVLSWTRGDSGNVTTMKLGSSGFAITSGSIAAATATKCFEVYGDVLFSSGSVNVVNSITASNAPKFWARIQQAPIGTFSSTAYNLSSITRIGAGSYGIVFSTALGSALYSVNFNGQSGSAAGNQTASLGYAINTTTNSFTMSTFLASSPVTPADFTTGSFQVCGS